MKAELNKLVDFVQELDVSGVLVDVTELNQDNDHFKNVAESVGAWARENIDPKLANHSIGKVAFVDPSGEFHGSEGAGPIVKDNAPDKHYFTTTTEALEWLQS
ncbi:MAG: hypothetical protein ACR2MT_05230 [Aurantibacter sp.]